MARGFSYLFFLVVIILPNFNNSCKPATQGAQTSETSGDVCRAPKSLGFFYFFLSLKNVAPRETPFFQVKKKCLTSPTL